MKMSVVRTWWQAFLLLRIDKDGVCFILGDKFSHNVARYVSMFCQLTNPQLIFFFKWAKKQAYREGRVGHEFLTGSLQRTCLAREICRVIKKLPRISRTFGPVLCKNQSGYCCLWLMTSHLYFWNVLASTNPWTTLEMVKTYGKM